MPAFAKEQLRKLFIGGLNLDTTEDGLKEYFSRWGETVDVVVMRFPDTRKSRGFGFVTYESVESVDAVLNAKPHVLDGKDIEPKRAVAKEDTPHTSKEEAEKCQKIFVGGLASATTEDDVRDCFTKFCEEAGHGRVEEVLIMRDRENNDRLRGFCFVTFDSPEIVDKVCSVKYFEIRTKTVEVRRAETRTAMMKKEERNYSHSRRRMEDRRRDGNDSFQGPAKMRGNFYGNSGFNPMAMQAAMSGGGSSSGGMPFFGGFGGGMNGGSGGFGGGNFNMNPMAVAGMMNMLMNMSNMGMNTMSGGGGGMGSGMGSGIGSNMPGVNMGSGSSDGMGGHNRGNSGYRNDMGDSYKGSSSISSGFKSNSYSGDTSTGNPGSSDVFSGSQNSSMYNEQGASGMGDMSGYANAMNAMFGAAGVNPANVQAALYSAYGGGGGGGNVKSDFGAYNDQSSSGYGPSRNSSTSTNRGYKPY